MYFLPIFYNVFPISIASLNMYNIFAKVVLVYQAEDHNYCKAFNIKMFYFIYMYYGR